MTKKTIVAILLAALIGSMTPSRGLVAQTTEMSPSMRVSIVTTLQNLITQLQMEIARLQNTAPGANIFTVTPLFSRELSLGSRGDDVVRLQQFLVGKGYLSIPQGVAYGYFGPLTLAALANFQRNNELPPTGYFDSLTMGWVSHLIAQTPSTGGTGGPVPSY